MLLPLRVHSTSCGRLILTFRRQAVKSFRSQASAAAVASDLQLEPPEPGTVKEHDHHVFLWAPEPEGRAATGEPDWPSKVERQALWQPKWPPKHLAIV